MLIPDPAGGVGSPNFKLLNAAQPLLNAKTLSVEVGRAHHVSILWRFHGTIATGKFNVTSADKKDYTGAWAIEDSVVGASDSQDRTKIDGPVEHIRIECTEAVTGGGDVTATVIAYGE